MSFTCVGTGRPVGLTSAVPSRAAASTAEPGVGQGAKTTRELPSAALELEQLPPQPLSFQRENTVEGNRSLASEKREQTHGNKAESNTGGFHFISVLKQESPGLWEPATALKIWALVISYRICPRKSLL